ncbi:uncharacterized protein LOC118745636 [Rhagoletis pomonella]|uniref:uncharacterized protein LOC118745636 n=1 Tax=Rhagoletis pomonella TaxID=28610 RepID=UPI00177CE850|nr:uncharacterized protein LOC118745636 [Rhagoletis pomonella]
MPEKLCKVLDEVMGTQRRSIELISNAFDAKFKDLSIQVDALKNLILSLHSTNNLNASNLNAVNVGLLAAEFDASASYNNNNYCSSPGAVVAPAAPLSFGSKSVLSERTSAQSVNVISPARKADSGGIASSSGSKTVRHVDGLMDTNTVAGCTANLLAGTTTTTKPTTPCTANVSVAANSSLLAPVIVNNISSAGLPPVSQHIPTGGVSAKSEAVNATAAEVPNPPSPTRSPVWLTAESKRTKHIQKRTRVMGSNNCSDLGVAARFKWLHLSSFVPTVSCENIVDYVVRHAGIDKRHLTCYKFVKKESRLDSLSYINFKLGVSEFDCENLMRPELWPANVSVRPFRFFHRGTNQTHPN